MHNPFHKACLACITAIIRRVVIPCISILEQLLTTLVMPLRGRLKVPHYGQCARGELLPQSKLTERHVREIVERHRGGESHSVIAKDLGVSRATITMVLHVKVWRHVTETLPILPHDNL